MTAAPANVATAFCTICCADVPVLGFGSPTNGRRSIEECFGDTAIGYVDSGDGEMSSVTTMRIVRCGKQEKPEMNRFLTTRTIQELSLPSIAFIPSGAAHVYFQDVETHPAAGMHPAHAVRVALRTPDIKGDPVLSADDLRDLAAVFTELADALDAVKEAKE